MGTVESAMPLNIDRPDWMLQAACVDQPLEMFFPGPGKAGAALTRKAKQICRTCPVVNDCLFYALSFGDRHCPGIWGMTTERERHRIHHSTTGLVYRDRQTRR